MMMPIVWIRHWYCILPPPIWTSAHVSRLGTEPLWWPQLVSQRVIEPRSVMLIQLVSQFRFRLINGRAWRVDVFILPVSGFVSYNLVSFTLQWLRRIWFVSVSLMLPSGGHWQYFWESIQYLPKLFGIGWQIFSDFFDWQILWVDPTGINHP